MDHFTEQITQLAYESCTHHKRHRKGEVTLRQLKHAINRHWATYRDGTIETWANHIYERASHTKLRSLLPALDKLLATESELYHWEHPDDSMEIASWSAWVLATLRWLNRERAGIANVPQYTDQELTDWLLQRQLPEQLTFL